MVVGFYLGFDDDYFVDFFGSCFYFFWGVCDDVGEDWYFVFFENVLCLVFVQIYCGFFIGLLFGNFFDVEILISFLVYYFGLDVFGCDFGILWWCVGRVMRCNCWVIRNGMIISVVFVVMIIGWMMMIGIVFQNVIRIVLMSMVVSMILQSSSC